MPKPIPSALIALALASILGACAWLPPMGADDAADSQKTADAAYVDYWQTRDPSEYRQRAASVASPQPVVPSPDVVVARRPAPPAKTESKPETRIVAIIPVQERPTTQSTESRRGGKISTVAAPTIRSSTPPTQAQRTAASGRAKSKGKSSPLASKDLWGRMRGRLALADVEHPRITERIDYLKRNPGYLNLFVQRAQPYLYYIVEHIDRGRLPMDLALVPMVESAFEPTAVSPKDAAGLWQIIPTTGQEWGLMLAEGYDGRFDIHTSTDVALRYLRYLNKLFNGDWLLALAAYNAGPRAVREAIAAHAAEPPPATAVETHPAVVLALALAASARPVAAPETTPQSLFWSLKLPKETQDYVPRIVALAHIIADPGAQGLQLQAIANQPYLYRVDLTPETKVFDSVVAAGIPIEEFSRFNPGFKPGVEPPAHAYKLLLPREQAQNLVASAPGARLLAPSRHTVQKGETLDIIAKRHGVPSQQLAQWNGLDGKGRLKAGQQLIVYPSS
ncbi:MAG: transglycosylase SLT domain-containing protein [Candidatus Contendobacter sp.]|nr:MAG: transglycosylase SLT domain-containing protein [Candidatus Contendobacter sp.]